ncbi:transcription termination factor Rho [Nocardioides sp.]|uniref:transcription termination factor Rho n=1 Tax=Nocardioides sp. TaxID=35761 RepID=UPI003D0FA870
MTDTIETTTAAPDSAPKKRGGGLNSMLLADLKAKAGSMGIAGSGTMKKAQLIDAIKSAQGSAGGQQRDAAPQEKEKPRTRARRTQAEVQPEAQSAAQPEAQREPQAVAAPAAQSDDRKPERSSRREPRKRVADPAQPAVAEAGADHADHAGGDPAPEGNSGRRERNQRNQRNQERQQERQQERTQPAAQARDSQARDNQARDNQARDNQARDNQARDNQARDNQARDNQARDNQERDEEGGRRNRRRRGRDRDGQGVQRDNQRDPQQRENPRNQRNREPDTTILEDDILVPAAGILDVLDNYAFVRTSGYLPGSDDVYLAMSMVRRLGLRRGDALVGQVRQPREGERKEKFNPMVRVDSVNGADPESAKDRVEFQKFTPLHANERLRLETDATNLIGRVIDIAAPIGKGQRGLIVSPPKAGKTMVLQSIANSITTNNPECHLMIVLVDERPEEVTDFQRTVKGEVIASTFDRPATDHTMVAELAIERAKRLVELGHDVVVLLDSITRLGRAYNLAAPASGRILSGGVDSSALYPPKRFFGAARNIENGGSLTILATALVETGSKMDEVIFEEFKGTGNMELRLRRDFADKRIFPAIDAVQSGTRREELLMTKEETAIVWKLRRVLAALDGQQALELLLERLKKSHSNVEFLMQVQKTTPAVNTRESD